MKKIAVISGASSGIGKKFTETISEFCEELDEIWVIARRESRLEELQTPFPIRPLAMDLTERASFDRFSELLNKERPNVRLLINASGYGKFEATLDTELSSNLNMVDLNCQALQAMCQLTIPFMSQGSRIINIASVAAFQPIPYINVYGASKAFVLSYSRALNREMKSHGISVTAVCPFWTKTEFFARAVISDKEPVVKKYVAMYEPEQIVKRAWHDAKRGKDVSKYGFIARLQAGMCKILPHNLIMSIWMKQQKLK
ncbi:MAG: SDR family NAD(P)-dependent oxidoreductase [Clostridia bacterium]|nr:SDR family NAD(P)-dependent oxidoreductase [Clostridia bacterium]